LPTAVKKPTATRSRKTRQPRPQTSSAVFGVSPNLSSVNVTEDTALTYSAVYRAVNILATTIGSLPIKVCRRYHENGRKKTEIIDDHPVSEALTVEPNGEQTPIVWMEYLVASMALRGNAYNEISMSPDGKRVELWPLQPAGMSVKRKESSPESRNRPLVYKYTAETTSADLDSGAVLHIPLYGDGIVGKSPISLARQGIGLGLAAEGFGATWFGHGSQPSGILVHPGKIGDNARQQLKQAIRGEHGGVNNANKVMVLEGGMEWKQIGIAPEDAQFLETRQFQVTDIARWYGIPPHMLGEMGRATWSNVEQLNIEFVTYTLTPYIVRIEQELKRKLLRGERGMYVKIVVDGLLRGDSAARFDRYEKGNRMGVYSINDILELEDRNPIDDDLGELRFVQANMQTLENAAKAKPEPAPQKPGGNPEPTEDKPDPSERVLSVMLRATMDRMVHRETKAIRRVFSKERESVDRETTIADGVTKFYSDHEFVIERELSPISDCFQEVFGTEIAVRDEASRIAADSRTTLLGLLGRDHAPEAFEELLAAWDQHRANNLASELIERWKNATA
jgi:HK97 family phage portal protein